MKRSERMGGPHTAWGVGDEGRGQGDSWIYPDTQR